MGFRCYRLGLIFFNVIYLVRRVFCGLCSMNSSLQVATCTIHQRSSFSDIRLSDENVELIITMNVVIS